MKSYYWVSYVNYQNKFFPGVRALKYLVLYQINDGQTSMNCSRKNCSKAWNTSEINDILQWSRQESTFFKTGILLLKKIIS